MDLDLDYLWSEDAVVVNDLDGHLIQDSYDRTNAGISLAGSDGSWVVALIGRNLGDEKTFRSRNDVRLANFGFYKSLARHIAPPQTLELNARYNF